MFSSTLFFFFFLFDEKYIKYFFFFFQAEDGIRDGHVTGVQTCALPIFCRRSASLYYARHQTSLKTGAHSGRSNLVIPQNSRGYCSWHTASSSSQGLYKPFRHAEEKYFRRPGEICRRKAYIYMRG